MNDTKKAISALREENKKLRAALSDLIPWAGESAGGPSWATPTAKAQNKAMCGKRRLRTRKTSSRTIITDSGKAAVIELVFARTRTAPLQSLRYVNLFDSIPFPFSKTIGERPASWWRSGLINCRRVAVRPSGFNSFSPLGFRLIVPLATPYARPSRQLHVGGRLEGLCLIRGKADFQAFGVSLYGLFQRSSSFSFHAIILPVENIFVNPLTPYLFTGRIMVDVGSNDPQRKTPQVLEHLRGQSSPGFRQNATLAIAILA